MSAPRETVLEDLQLIIRERLLADPYLADIPVFYERIKNLEVGITNALAVLTTRTTKVGAAIMVMSPVASLYAEAIQQSPLDTEQAIRVLENPLFNTGTSGTQKSALALARRILRVMNHFQAIGYCTVMTAEKPALVPVDDPIAPLAYEVRFKYREADGSVAKFNSPPTLSQTKGNPATVTITNNEPGSAIHFTTDGTYPHAGNGTLYSGPITLVYVNGEATIHAVASLASQIDSAMAGGYFEQP
jgi:hypothetical protein